MTSVAVYVNSISWLKAVLLTPDGVQQIGEQKLPDATYSRAQEHISAAETFSAGEVRSFTLEF